MADIKTCTFDAAHTSVDGLLAGPLAARIGFVFESIDPASRVALKSYIGLDCSGRDLGIGAASDAEFAALLEKRGAHGGQGGCVLVTGYHASVAGQGPNQSQATTPGQLLVEPGLLIIIDHRQGSATLVDYAAMGGLAEIAEMVQSSPAAAINLDRETLPPLEWKQNLSQVEFVEIARKLVGQVEATQELEGAVLSVRQTGDYAADPVVMYRHLRQIAPSTYMFVIRHGDFAVVGATSLTLLRGEGKELIAETDGATHKVVPGEPAWVPDEKEMSEYDAVVHALEEDLQSLVAPGTLRLTVDREIRQFFTLAHIFAEMRGELRPEIGVLQAIARLSPHGATLGHPRSAAAALIEEMEKTPRGAYAGSVSFFGDNGDFEVATVIRSLWQTGGQVAFQAGAKIVPGSDPASEYSECVMKMQSLRDCVGLSLRAAAANDRAKESAE